MNLYVSLKISDSVKKLQCNVIVGQNVFTIQYNMFVVLHITHLMEFTLLSLKVIKPIYDYLKIDIDFGQFFPNFEL